MRHIFQLMVVFISFQAAAQMEASWTCDWRNYHTMKLEGLDARRFIAEPNPDDQVTHRRYLFTISDKDAGYYKIFTDGLKIWDSAGTIIPEGVLKNNDSPDPIDYTTIIPIEEYQQKRYFVISRFIENFSAGPGGTSILFDYQLSYSIIDIEDGSNISIKEKNIEIIAGQDLRYDNMSAAICGTIKHSDNIGTWLIMKHSLSDSYYIFLVNACGIELVNIYPVKDLVPNYDELQERHYTCMELYYNGYLMDVRNKGAVKLNYFFRFDSTTGELSYYKHFNFNNRYYHWYQGFERYWMYLTDSLYFYTGGSTMDEDLVFHQYDLKNTPSGDIEPHFSYFMAKEDIEVIQALPEARVRDTRIYPYTQGRVFLSARIGYAGGDTRTDAEIFAEFKSPQKKCPDCDLGPFVLQLDNHPDRPGFGQNSRWYYYMLHNRTHFAPDWKAPEMGKPELRLSEYCTGKEVELTLADTVRGDSLLVFTGTDTIIFYGDKNKYLSGKNSFIFQHPGQHTLSSVRYLNCVTDTSTHLLEIAEAPLAPSEIIAMDTIYSCDSQKIEITLKAEDGLDYTWSNGQTGANVTFSREGTYTLATSNECGDRMDTVIIVFPELFIPNLVTPNQDSMNDQLTILPGSEKGHLFIFNRWGERIFESENYQNCWPQGEVKDGVYFYHYTSNRGGCERKGWLQVIK